MTKLASDSGLTLDKVNWNSTKFLSDIKEIEGPKMMELVWKSKILLERYRKEFVKTNPGCSVADLVKHIKENHPMTQEDKTSLDIYITCDVEDEWGAGASDLDAKYYDRAQSFEGGDWLVVGGYSRIFDGIVCKEPVVLETTVQTIQQNETGCLVSTNTGRLYLCDYVICTVPLGVLKKQMINFEPPLSNQKLKSIEKMGFKTLNKVFVIFESVFWGDDSQFIYYRNKETNEM